MIIMQYQIKTQKSIYGSQCYVSPNQQLSTIGIFVYYTIFISIESFNKQISLIINKKIPNIYPEINTICLSSLNWNLTREQNL